MSAAFSMPNSLQKGTGKGPNGNNNGAPAPPPRPKTPKPKKLIGITKQVQQKISIASAKLTDLKVMINKVNQSPLLLVL